ncbi:MAG: Shedu anti-phage system protein SduA domain-containing protein [Nitrospiraceae bacterium]
MDWWAYEKIILKEWRALLSSEESKSEAALRKFLERHPCMVPGSRGPFGDGHHVPFPAAVISQPTLPGLHLRVPDFLWLAMNSESIYPVLVEIEAPSKRWFTKSGKQTEQLTQALDQLAEWKTWFARTQNVAQFVDYYTLNRRVRSGMTLKPFYVLIYGRRHEANRLEHLAEKRGHLGRENEFLMTFDRLHPNPLAKNFLCVRRLRDGYEALSVPPTLELSRPLAGYFSFIAGKTLALSSSPYLSDDRKEFLGDRFSYWDNWVKERRWRRYCGGE